MQPKRHAPKGPLIQKDPVEAAHPTEPLRCKATNRQGKRCGRPPIAGGTVCYMHGGAAPQVKQKALDRLMALQHPAITRLEQLIGQEAFPTVAYAASRDVLDRTLGKAKEQVAITGGDGGPIEYRWKT